MKRSERLIPEKKTFEIEQNEHFRSFSSIETISSGQKKTRDWGLPKLLFRLLVFRQTLVQNEEVSLEQFSEMNIFDN